MRGKDPTRSILVAMAICGLLVAMPRHAMARTNRPSAFASGDAAANTGKGVAAIDTAARDGKYLFVFFWKGDDKQTRTMYGVFQSAMRKWADSTSSMAIRVTDPAEKPIVEKLRVGRAPMPLVVALAPNGAITRAFPIRFTEQQLESAFVSPATATCMRALQHRKLVVLCVQNQQTQLSQAALRGAHDFQADARFSEAAEVVTIDPADRAEEPFLRALQVDPRTPTAVTVLLAPPGKPVARFAGAVTKDQIVAKVQAGPCAGGKCGPGGCCPQR